MVTRTGTDVSPEEPERKLKFTEAVISLEFI
jgi:hypothetical protein